jgi:hypothetical protein
MQEAAERASGNNQQSGRETRNWKQLRLLLCDLLHFHLLSPLLLDLC